MDSIVSVLINRDGYSLAEARKEVCEARAELMERLANGDYCEDFCQEYFGLEPDYLMELL